MVSKWEQFSFEELQQFANETHNQKDFCIKVGYSGKNDRVIKAIREKYPNFIFPKRQASNFQDLTGQTFNRLTVIQRDLEKPNDITYWICKCTCGNIITVRAYDLKQGKTKSCGCLRNEKVREAIGDNLKGEHFGLLTVIEQVDSIREESGTTRTAWRCSCECGRETIVKTRDLVAGDTKSCGCISQSYGSIQIEKILKENNVSYEKEYSFSNLKSDNGYCLRFDFAIFQNNELKYLIERQGKQHYEPVELFGGEEGFLSQIKRDNLKREYCNNNQIPLIEINYSKSRIIYPEEVIRKEILCI